MQISRLLLVLLLTVLLTGRVAMAASATVTICAKYQVDFDDSDISGDDSDYFDTNNDKKARGVFLIADPTDGSADVSGYAEWDEGQADDPGCLTMTLDDSKTYDLKIQSRLYVKGNYVHVKNYDGITPPPHSEPSQYWFSTAVATRKGALED